MSRRGRHNMCRWNWGRCNRWDKETDWNATVHGDPNLSLLRPCRNSTLSLIVKNDRDSCSDSDTQNYREEQDQRSVLAADLANLLNVICVWTGLVGLSLSRPAGCRGYIFHVNERRDMSLYSSKSIAFLSWKKMERGHFWQM